MAEKTQIKTRIILRNAELTAWEKSSVKLLAGEMALARLSGDYEGCYKVRIGTGDKTWNELSDYGQLIIPAANVEGLTEAIASLSTSYFETDDITKLSVSYVNGDIAVEKKNIAGGKQEYCAYRFDTSANPSGAVNGAWKALDGNYSSDNVFFKEDITCAGNYDKVGNITKDTTGTTTIAAAGKSVTDVFQSIFTKELPAEITTHPSWSFTGNSDLTDECGLTYNPAGVTATFSNKGAYKYGPDDTGVRVPMNNMTVKRTTTGFQDELSNNVELNQGGTVSIADWSTAQTYTHSKVEYNYEAYAYHTEGVSALTNLEKTSSVKIAANDWSNSTAASACKKTAKITYQGYYPCYYGQSATDIVANPEAITSSDIVNYTGGVVTAKTGFTKEVRTAERPADRTTYSSYTCKQWYWIVPKGKITSVYARQNSPAAPLGTVKQKATTIWLPTSNGFGDVEYDVWYVNNDNAAPNGYAWKLNGTF